MSALRLRREDTALLLIDVQERLAAAMPPAELERMLRRTAGLIEGARALALPISLTEQYPRGLGPTVASLRDRLPGIAPVEKLRFGALDERVRAGLANRVHVLVAGMETHVCVYQTVRQLSDEGFRPVLCADAVISRFAIDHAQGLRLAEGAGATVATVEAVLFDLLGEAGTPEFKRVSAAIR
ncbi:MAG TPA: isochorismatase family protein [Myxococcaceae bacterium]|nr:isochorismatase family protein [Myxococcaceae bacterium]